MITIVKKRLPGSLWKPLWLPIFLAVLVGWFLLPLQVVYAMDVTLAWDANTEADLAGYRVFVREEGQGHDYANPTWEGAATTCTIRNLDSAKNYYFVARAFDTSDNESADSEEVSYRANRSPVLTAIGAKTVSEGALLAFTVTASDPDGNGLAYAAGSLPAGASFNASTRQFSWTPGYAAAGSYTVTFTVTDDGTPVQSDSEAVKIDVLHEDLPPAPPGGLEILR
jgi:hypothetical protein